MIPVYLSLYLLFLYSISFSFRFLRYVWSICLYFSCICLCSSCTYVCISTLYILLVLSDCASIPFAFQRVIRYLFQIMLVSMILPGYGLKFNIPYLVVVVVSKSVMMQLIGVLFGDLNDFLSVLQRGSG